jgi:O-antigen ligase
MDARQTRAPKAPRRAAWFALMALGLAILVLVALARGMPHDVPWYLAHVLPLMVVVGFTTTAIGRSVATWALVAYALGLPAVAWIVGFGPFDPWNEPARLQLFTDNPNLLGADLVAVFLAATLLRPKGPWVWLLPLVAVAVVLTGSRTSLLALAVASGAWLLVPTTPARVRWVLAVGALFVVGFVGFANHQVQQDAAGANLVPHSVTFDHRSWTVYGDSVVQVTRGAMEGPFPRTRADLIIATSGAHPLTLYQGFGRSVEDTPYVASVYLRADTPQTVVLSNHLVRTPCDVTTDWTRCVTPVGTGNGRSARQFRFETVEPGQSFDVYAYGPQYEVGTTPTAYDPRGGGLLPSTVAGRFAALPLSPDALAAQRQPQLDGGWSTFMTTPWLGSGTSWSEVMNLPESNVRPRHAHNLLVERLAADGLVGVFGWMLIATTLLTPALLAFGWHAVPWLLALAVLNTWDMTWFHSGSYFSTAIVAGSAIGRLHSVRLEGGCRSLPAAHSRTEHDNGKVGPT